MAILPYFIKIKKILLLILSTWWIQVIILFASCIALCFLNLYLFHWLVVDISLAVIFLNLLLLCAGVVHLAIKRKWIHSLISAALLIFSIGMTFMYALLLLFMEMNMRDTYADELRIPMDIVIEKPLGDDYHIVRDSVTDSGKKEFDFILYNSFQPGLYEYDLWLSKIEKGAVYLKIYEITHNDRLSEKDITTYSTVKVENSSDSIQRFGTINHFTIYEGDWGKPYAARFEVWYKPNNGVEKKLTQKNYIIEGWQR
jgi:hypothetical protein